MKIIIEIPDMLFSIGHIVYIPNKNNKFGIYFKVINYGMLLGKVYISNLDKKYAPLIEYADYGVEIMQGSIADTEKLQSLAGYMAIKKNLLESGILVGKTENVIPLYDMSDNMETINSIRNSILTATNSLILIKCQEVVFEKNIYGS